jgi:hypothetical protein
MFPQCDRCVSINQSLFDLGLHVLIYAQFFQRADERTNVQRGRVIHKSLRITLRDRRSWRLLSRASGPARYPPVLPEHVERLERGSSVAGRRSQATLRGPWHAHCHRAIRIYGAARDVDGQCSYHVCPNHSTISGLGVKWTMLACGMKPTVDSTVTCRAPKSLRSSLTSAAFFCEFAKTKSAPRW